VTTRHRFFRIMAVDRAGTPWAEVTLSDPAAVLIRLEHLRSLTGRGKVHDRMYWVDDPNDEERGDIEMDVEELVYEAQQADEERRRALSLSDARWQENVRRRVWLWRLKRLPWGQLVGWVLVVLSSVFTTWLALSFAEWALR
jgi:hypothetical protein